MERGVAAAGKGFPAHQFRSIVHRAGRCALRASPMASSSASLRITATPAQAKERGARQERATREPSRNRQIDLNEVQVGNLLIQFHLGDIREDGTPTSRKRG